MAHATFTFGWSRRNTWNRHTNSSTSHRQRWKGFKRDHLLAPSGTFLIWLLVGGGLGGWWRWIGQKQTQIEATKMGKTIARNAC